MLAHALFSLATLATAVSAAPLAGPLAEKASILAASGPSNVEFNIAYSSNRTEGLPTTLILATGGTIAGSSASNLDSTTYQAGVVGVGQLIQAVPELLHVSNIDGMQVSNIASESMPDSVVLKLTKLANKALCTPNATYDGVVITHGTDTLEETAFTLDVTLQCDKPVVVVGAMRPSTAISADGPNNLLQAVTTASHPASRNRGALIVLNDRVCQAYYCEKTQANAVDTFDSPEPGYSGALLSDKLFYYSSAAQPTFKQTFDLSNVTALPDVDILYGYQGTDFGLLNATIADGAKGVVLAGTGAGSIPAAALHDIDAAAAKGIPLVRSTKINVGAAVPGDVNYDSMIAGGLLNPVKSRRLLQILLALNKTNDEIRNAFEGKLKSYLSYKPGSS
ncbi:hypothetical protein NBRC10512_002123 [Rhodotorula toruloides]|uniref:asparaginase n=1 Tax=Rhodotorula toruloides TaxID=5286 RepID=A0A061BGF5_RHOTO|nr:RHTO0S18e00606g1_1 [Rhodotorula toruloides]